MQTEAPYWLDEAYQSAITQLDIGLVSRNLHYAEIIEKWLLNGVINPDGKFLDFAGGYGMFVRLMRDKGFDFYRQDLYCDNIFSKHFDQIDLPDNQHYEAVTAFEVFEHLENPLAELRNILSYTNVIIFSTELQPDGEVNPSTWWYITPETGQHISLYNYKSLEFIASSENLHLYSNKYNLHILSKGKLALNPFAKPKENLLDKVFKKIKMKVSGSNKDKVKRESLLSQDFDYIKNLKK